MKILIYLLTWKVRNLKPKQLNLKLQNPKYTFQSQSQQMYHVKYLSTILTTTHLKTQR